MRFKRMYRVTLNVERFTGNGGGDGDDIRKEDADELEVRINSAKAGGKDIGDLNSKNLLEFYSKGWFKLFADRFVSFPSLQIQII
jgi:hypothetical protein